jgi:Ca-activated chloride channel family protein
MRSSFTVPAVAFAITTLLAQQQPTFKSGAETVAVYTTVTDSTGRLVPDLTKDDFEIYDDGKRQAITLFESGQQPITVVVMLDRSGSMAGNFNLVRAAAEQFVTDLQPGDKARIGSFADRIQVDPREFTSSHRDLIEILRTQLQEAGATPLWNAINVGITGLLHQDGRRVVLVFTDGMDHPMNGSANNVSLKDAMKRAQEEDVMVYAIGLAGRSGFGGRGRRGYGGGGTGGRVRPQPQADKPDPGLARIAADTGGGYFELTSTADLSSTFSRVVDELHRQYALAFVPERLDGKTHRVEVRLRDRFLTARTRKTYIAK